MVVGEKLTISGSEWRDDRARLSSHHYTAGQKTPKEPGHPGTHMKTSNSWIVSKAGLREENEWV